MKDLFGIDSKDLENDWRDHWKDMPEYDNEWEEEPDCIAVFKFKTREDYETFNKLIKKHLYNGDRVFDGMQRKERKTAWYPAKEKSSNYRYK